MNTPNSRGMAVVTGRVELYNGKPQIVITNPRQLQLSYEVDVPATQLPSIEQD